MIITHRTRIPVSKYKYTQYSRSSFKVACSKYTEIKINSSIYFDLCCFYTMHGFGINLTQS